MTVYREVTDPTARDHPTNRPDVWPWARLPFWPFQCRARSRDGHRCCLRPGHDGRHVVSRGMVEYEFEP